MQDAGVSALLMKTILSTQIKDNTAINAQMDDIIISQSVFLARHSELLVLEEDEKVEDCGSYIVDTPGFSSLYVNDFEKEQLKYCLLYTSIRQIRSNGFRYDIPVRNGSSDYGKKRMIFL